MQRAKELILENDYSDAKTIKRDITKMIEDQTKECSVQYAAITDNELLNDIDNLKSFKGEVLISLAVFFGKTRLIDNIVFTKQRT